jgi:hypothetical protein
VARIGNGTELDIVVLDEQNTDLRLPQGAADIHLRNPDTGEAVSTIVTTPRGDVSLSAPGRYLVEAGTTDQPTAVTVYDGQAQITDAAGATFDLSAGQAGLLTGNGNQPVFATRAAQPNPLDNWATQREQQFAATPLPPQVSPDMTGVATLAAYGGWQSEPAYGPVWFPRGVAAGWEPYRDGHWAYVRPWGWTWIDNARWGFAPFHYGRWVRIHDTWAWAPGAVTVQSGVVARAIYSPALVVFAALGVGGPDIAWYPLGWNEPYIPAYRVSRGYIERVNFRVVERPRLAEVTTIYDRLYARGGNFDPYQHVKVGVYRDRAIAVPRAAFQSARPVAAVATKPAPGQLRPMIRPTSVAIPPARPHPALRTAEPPKPKILPVTKRAPIPQKLMAPKSGPAGQPIPAAAVHPPAPLAQPKPAMKPAVTSPPKQPENRPALAKPETKPALTQPSHGQEVRPHAKPEAKPGVTHPANKPEGRPEAKPAMMRPPALSDHKPEARPAPGGPKGPPTHDTKKPDPKKPPRPNEKPQP